MTTPAGNHGALPPFYQQPVVLCADAHRRHGLRPDPDFIFAAESTAVPLGVGEFAQAQRHYPIVFASGPQPVPLAVTGIVQLRNLFVAENGAWQADHYVPGYLRRHPFILSAGESPDSAVLVVDQASSRFVDTREKPDAHRLFDDAGEPTAPTREATSFCLAAYQEEIRTAAFSRALDEAGLLVERQINITFANGNTQRVEGLRLVDDKAYRALPAETLTRWFTLGWLDAIGLQIASQQNWQHLVARHERLDGERTMSGSAPP